MLYLSRSEGGKMMNGYDERLRQLQAELSGRAQAQAEMNALTDRRQSLEQRNAELDRARRKRQSTVDRLGSRRLKGLVFDLFGRREEALQRERDALAATVVEWEQVARELENVAEQEQRARDRVRQMERAAQEYEQLIREKAECIVRSGGPAADEIRSLYQRIDRGEAMCRELTEAIDAGRKAERLAERAYDALSEANDWGTVDLVGGGLISDLAKYDQMEEAKQAVEKLQSQLGKFRVELADVAMDVQAEITFDGLFRFADIFFDDAFTALFSKSRIKNSMNSVREVQQCIRTTMSELEVRLRREKAEVSSARAQLRSTVIRTKI